MSGSHPIDDVDDDDSEACPDCGRLIFDDMEGFDDVCSAPYVCEAGDLHCIPCGRKCSAAMERDDEENAYDEFDPYDAAGESRFGLPGGGKVL